MTTTLPSSHIDLLEQPLTAAFATVAPDGKPQVTALWYLLGDDGVIRISVNSSRRKLSNVKAQPVGTLFLVDPANSMRTLEVRADIELSDDPDYTFAETVVAHYGADFDMRDIDQPGDTRLILTLHPTRVNAN